MKEPEILLEEWSPVCDIHAFVEQTDRCCYFYLWVDPSSEDASMKSCWVCNTGKAPRELDVASMEQGIAPAMPDAYVLHDKDGIELDPQRLHIVWFEEGDAAALLSGDEILCVIPGWSGYKGFHGYARYAKGTSPCAWGLAEAFEAMSERVGRSRAFWEWFEQDDYWEIAQRMHLDALQRFYGHYQNYFAIDGGGFPPRALIRGVREGISYGVTAGMSLIPMPCVEQYHNEAYREHRRIELGFAAAEGNDGLCTSMYSWLSALSAYPWRACTFLAHGHTIPFQVIEGFRAVLLIDPEQMSGMEAPPYETCMGERVRLLWAVPITAQEYAFATAHEIDELLACAVGDSAKMHIYNGMHKFDVEAG